jgi:hypothetical protein
MIRSDVPDPVSQRGLTMTEATSANLEMAIVLPLGVVANQLRRIEADLRLLNMKVVDFAEERANGRRTRLIEALEDINEALDAIRGLVSDIEADIQPSSKDVTGTSTRQHTSQIGTHLPVDDTSSFPDVVHSAFSNRKPHPDEDD